MDKGKRPQEPEIFETPISEEPVEAEPISQVPPSPSPSPVKTTQSPAEREPSVFETLYAKASGGEERSAHSPTGGGVPEMSTGSSPLGARGRCPW